MYSLLVSHLVEDHRSSVVDISKDRFLEYTSDVISSQLVSLANETIDCVKSWPCILMQEGRGQEVAHIVCITAVQIAAADIKLVIDPIPGRNSLINEALWKLRTELDIAQFEFSRNHWAFKDRHLFPILARAGYSFDTSAIAAFAEQPLPAPTRRELLSARDVLSEWTHTDIDDFLLEVGIAGLEAARAIGSRRDRANAIIEYALANPTATTAENSMFSAYVVRAVAKATEPSESIMGATRAAKPVAESREGSETRISDDRMPNRVFIVHGQNETARAAVVSVLTKLGLEAIILHEQPNMGRHLLTKFIEEAELVTFAVVLMTDDDIGALKGAKLTPRARQNVILELGYFLSHLGQQSVCALITPGLETPSDFDGIVYIRMDDAGNWEGELQRELKAAGMPIVE
jgi:predicted nucleotide-binding protein